jgi:hypothetical protein
MPDIAVGRALILAALLAVPAHAWAQAMYKWVDEKGVTHFSGDPPPEGAKAQKFEPKVTPPSSSVAPPAESPDKWKGQEAEFRKRQIERDKRDAADARTSEQRKKRCDEARRKVEWYESGRIYRDNPDGSRTWMSDSNRESVLQQYRQAMKENCD